MFLLALFAISIIAASTGNAAHGQSPVTGLGTWSEQTDYGASSGSKGTGGVTVQSEPCVTDSNYIYCVGGYTGTKAGPGGSIGISSQVFFAAISASGVIGAWTETTDYGATAGTSGNGGVAIEWNSCVAYNHNIYCVGGNGMKAGSNPGPLSSVYFAPLSSSGVGPWTETTDYGASSGSTGASKVYAFQTSCVQNSGYIYCVGGLGKSKTYYSQLLPSGVGPWTETTDYGAGSGTSGSGGVPESAASCVADSALASIYCVGGQGGSFANISDVFYAPLSSSGIGAWKESIDYGATSGTSGSGGIPIYGVECADYSQTIICADGSTSSSTIASVYFSSLSTSGVGSWRQTTNYGDDPAPLYFMGFVIYLGEDGEWIIGIGGSDESVVYDAEVEPSAETTTTEPPTTTTQTTTSTSNTQTSTSTSMFTSTAIITVVQTPTVTLTYTFVNGSVTTYTYQFSAETTTLTFTVNTATTSLITFTYTKNPSSAVTATQSSFLTVGPGVFSVNQGTTGINLAVSGISAPSGTPVLVVTNDLSGPTQAQPPNNMRTALYYDVQVEGVTDGTANTCITNQAATSSSIIEYWNSVDWANATGTSTSGTTVCGNIPVADLQGTNIAVGTIGTPTPEFPSWSLMFVMLAVLVPVLYLVRRSRIGGTGANAL